MIEIHSKIIHPLIKDLLSYATSKKRIAQEYKKYIQSSNRKLYVAERKGIMAGCIGIKFIEPNVCEIKHIAVFPPERGNRIGSEMIDFIMDKHLLNSVFAETDLDAVEFYRNYGFEISDLGEKYPSVERFLCEYKIQ
ncbi:GNAT family N-acetyltransferase [Halobacillus shinanisalinarum]|uniref:GNAT family N-acetyltransferase n=1 Tax=Halobacillus shinanisalinarum TaxID=2932258 RepID=A0ABY4GU45_9BACI|nr:GNAT family N-acetyltransferase [Halobacillus shinanisalinarum]UOQ91461.1 GNAT family N-acetyltransferase [Halobacillus shinanisalinarum]